MPKTYAKIRGMVKRLEELGELNDLRFQVRAGRFAAAVYRGVDGNDRDYWRNLWLGGGEKAKQILAEREKLGGGMEAYFKFHRDYPKAAAWAQLGAELAGGLRKEGFMDKDGRVCPRNNYADLLIGMAEEVSSAFNRVRQKSKEGRSKFDAEGRLSPFLEVTGEGVEEMTTPITIDESRVIEVKVRDVKGEGSGPLL